MALVRYTVSNFTDLEGKMAFIFLEKFIQKRSLCTCSLGCKVVSPLVRILGGFEFKIRAILNPDLFFYENAMPTLLLACYVQLKLLTCFKFLD